MATTHENVVSLCCAQFVFLCLAGSFARVQQVDVVIFTNFTELDNDDLHRKCFFSFQDEDYANFGSRF